MTLDGLIGALVRMRENIRKDHDVAGDEIQAVLWNGDDITPVTCIDYDWFDVDGPCTVEIRKVGDP